MSVNVKKDVWELNGDDKNCTWDVSSVKECIDVVIYMERFIDLKKTEWAFSLK